MDALSGWHHAYVIEGQERAALQEIEVFFEQEGIALRGNPDYQRLTVEQFLIDDAIRLSRNAYLRAVGDKKIFVCSFGFITHEAQNALLKLFEEPPQGTHFFLIVSNASLLLPTVRSRMVVVRLGDDVVNEGVFDIEAFLSAGKGERLVLVKDIAAERAQAALFFDELERYFAAHTKTHKQLETLYRAQQYIRDRGASSKMLLEYVALMLY